jgi:hypothetical protein
VVDLSRAVEAGLLVFWEGRVLRPAGAHLWAILEVGFRAVVLNRVVAEAGLLGSLAGKVLRQVAAHQ